MTIIASIDIKSLKESTMNIIEELDYGNVTPNAKCFDCHSNYAQFIKTISENEEKLTAYLENQAEAKKEQHLFSQLMNAQGEVLEFSETSRFLEGFRLGAKFMLDAVVIPQDSVIRDIV